MTSRVRYGEYAGRPVMTIEAGRTFLTFGVAKARLIVEHGAEIAAFAKSYGGDVSAATDTRSGDPE